MSGVLKNRKKKEDAEELRRAALQEDSTKSEENDPTKISKERKIKDSTISVIEDDSDSEAEFSSKAKASAVAGSKRKRGTDEANPELFNTEQVEGDQHESKKKSTASSISEAAPASSSNNNAELRINERGNIEDDGDDGHAQIGINRIEGNEDGPDNEDSVRPAPAQRAKKFIKRRLKRYLSLEDKIAVFQRIVHDIDPKTKKLRYGASNEICADYNIGRKTINNIKNLFEGLIRDGRNLNEILSIETLNDIPTKLNIIPTDETAPVLIGNPIEGFGDSSIPVSTVADSSDQKVRLATLKDNLKSLTVATNASGDLANAIKVKINNDEDDDSSNDEAEAVERGIRTATSASSGGLPRGTAGVDVMTMEGEGNHGSDETNPAHSIKYKTLYDEDTRLRKMLKVNNVGRQTKLNDLTIERIRTIVPYCYGVKELSDMYEKEFGEKIHQSTLWRYCAELNIKIPKKTANKK